MTRYNLYSGVQEIKTKAQRVKTGVLFGLAGLFTAVAMPLAAHAAIPTSTPTYTPFTYIGAAGDCGTGYPAGKPGGASATSTGGTLTLTKSAPTTDCSSAV